MLGGQAITEPTDKQNLMNPQKDIMCAKVELEGNQEVKQTELFKRFEVEQNENLNSQKNNIQVSHNKNEMQVQVDGQIQAGQMQPQNEQSRPSPPIQQSYSNSNNSKTKTKTAPISNQLIRLTKKATTSHCKKQKKIRYYVTDFEPYLPSFIDQMHRQHHKNIIRIGQNYQASIQQKPKFQSLHRPMNHLKVWNGSSDGQFDEEVFKKFKQIFGQYRTEQELILLKYRLNIETWPELMKQLNEQKQQGKKMHIQIPNNHMNGTTTRIK